MPAYSNTPLLKKLGIKENFTVLFLNPPNDYFELLGDLPENLNIIESPNTAPCDFIHAFVMSQKELESCYIACKKALKRNGMFWISWPKKSSKVPCDLDENIIRDYILNNGLVDVKVASINDIFSALKLVYRLKDR